jgi:hypothetical protein
MFGAKVIKAAVFALIALPLVAWGGAAAAKDKPSDGPPPPAGPAQAQQTGKSPGFLGRILGEGAKGNPGPCPLLGVLYESSRLVELRAPEERFANVGYTGEINGLHGLCTYSGASPIEMSVDIDMAFGHGPMADGQTHTYRYWVAVTRTNIAPLAKEYFDVPVRFEKGQMRLLHTEKIKRIVIPRANAEVAGPAFEILVGFELTPEQLAFNRAGKRFKVNAGGGG